MGERVLQKMEMRISISMRNAIANCKFPRRYPSPCFLKVFILKGVKVVCFDTVLEVLILKGVKSGRICGAV
jgi:hypothetical protein